VHKGAPNGDVCTLVANSLSGAPYVHLTRAAIDNVFDWRRRAKDVRVRSSPDGSYPLGRIVEIRETVILARAIHDAVKNPKYGLKLEILEGVPHHQVSTDRHQVLSAPNTVWIHQLASERLAEIPTDVHGAEACAVRSQRR
jgi:hypothetical protein